MTATITDRHSITDKAMIEEGDTFAPKFNDQGLIPVVTTCFESGMVLMQAWMNAEAIERTLAIGEAHYFSRSRQVLWHKGQTSGEVQIVEALRTDCDQDALWMEVKQLGGGCCHTKRATCFYRDIVQGDAILKLKKV